MTKQQGRDREVDRYGQKVEWEDVQSLVRRPYAHWEHSAHLILSIHDTQKAREFLRDWYMEVRVAGEVYPIDNPDGTAPKRHHTRHFNVAFTVDGLRKLGMTEDDLSTFDRAFVEGMAPEPVQPSDLDEMAWREQLIRKQGTTRRAGILGDLHENHASKWRWGGIATGPDAQRTKDASERVLQHQVDVMVMVFSKTKERVERSVEYILHPDTGLRDPLRPCRGSPTPSNHKTVLSGREHFGFKDGISQPLFPDTRKAREVSARWRETHQVAAGEFILGYLNERDEYAEVPSVGEAFVTEADVPGCSEHPNRWDFGRNGTYLVARQLDQDVAAFDALVEQAANLMQRDLRGLDMVEDASPPLRQAAERLIGRRYNGDPISEDIGPAYVKKVYPFRSCSADKKEVVTEENDFTYQRTDRAGTMCPIGSHVRRSNPRDSLDPSPDVSLSLSKQHRILRRGRNYGPVCESPNFQRHRQGKTDSTERGLFFICLNTDIAGQFEFIQDTWVNNPNFGDLEGERDPILSVSIDTRVSLPSKPFTRWFERGRPVVTVRGGAYFFMPGRRALEALAKMKDLDPDQAEPHVMFNGLSAADLRKSSVVE